MKIFIDCVHVHTIRTNILNPDCISFRTGIMLEVKQQTTGQFAINTFNLFCKIL